MTDIATQALAGLEKIAEEIEQSHFGWANNIRDQVAALKQASQVAMIDAAYRSIKQPDDEDGVIDDAGNAVAYGVVGARFEPGTKLYTHPLPVAAAPVEQVERTRTT